MASFTDPRVSTDYEAFLYAPKLSYFDLCSMKNAYADIIRACDIRAEVTLAATSDGIKSATIKHTTPSGDTDCYCYSVDVCNEKFRLDASYRCLSTTLCRYFTLLFCVEGSCCLVRPKLKRFDLWRQCRQDVLEFVMDYARSFELEGHFLDVHDIPLVDLQDTHSNMPTISVAASESSSALPVFDMDSIPTTLDVWRV